MKSRNIISFMIYSDFYHFNLECIPGGAEPSTATEHITVELIQHAGDDWKSTTKSSVNSAVPHVYVVQRRDRSMRRALYAHFSSCIFDVESDDLYIYIRDQSCVNLIF